MYHALARPDSQFLCFEVQSHSDGSPGHAPGPRSACAYGTPFVTKLEIPYGHHVSLHGHRVSLDGHRVSLHMVTM